MSTAPRQTYDAPDPRRWRAPVLVPAGRLGDARGRRTVFVVGLVLFTCASGACGLAPSPDWLTAARLAQGMGAGLIIPQSAGLIQALFRGAERGRAFGRLGASIGLSTAVGPLLGGTIIAAAGTAEAWRWVFLVNVPVGLAELPLAWRLIPAELGSGRRESLDPVGVLLLAIGLLLQNGLGYSALRAGATDALSSGLRVSIAFVLASLALAVADQAGARRTRSTSPPDEG